MAVYAVRLPESMVCALASAHLLCLGRPAAAAPGAAAPARGAAAAQAGRHQQERGGGQVILRNAGRGGGRPRVGQPRRRPLLGGGRGAACCRGCRRRILGPPVGVDSGGWLGPGPGQRGGSPRCCCRRCCCCRCRRVALSGGQAQRAWSRAAGGPAAGSRLALHGAQSHEEQGVAHRPEERTDPCWLQATAPPGA